MGCGEVGKWGSGVWGVGCRVLAIFRGKVPEFSPGSLQRPVLIEPCF
ncbi:hypothetical protein RVR34_18960 [Microcystis aeruginosa FBCC-A68]